MKSEIILKNRILLDVNDRNKRCRIEKYLHLLLYTIENFLYRLLYHAQRFWAYNEQKCG